MAVKPVREAAADQATTRVPATARCGPGPGADPGAVRQRRRLDSIDTAQALAGKHVAVPHMVRRRR
jgi:hypothetical protein